LASLDFAPEISFTYLELARVGRAAREVPGLQAGVVHRPHRDAEEDPLSQEAPQPMPRVKATVQRQKGGS